MNLRIAAISLGLLTSSLVLSGQTPDAAPVPSQLATASNVFLASGGAFATSSRQSSLASTIYSSFYRALAASGKYHFVRTPADAQLSMILSAQTFVSDAINGSSFASPYLRLEVYDIRTHTLLWNLSEPIKGAMREKTFDKNVDDSVAALVADLKTLASGTIPGDPAVPSIKNSSDTEKK